MPNSASPPPSLLSIKNVVARTSLSRSTVYRLAANGKFPASVEISPGRKAWIEAEIADWIDQRISATRHDR
ncbi:MAG: AlpA family phage regulatory protein [Delftia acidovorans]|nr:AlpA family phage regulatory protein [Hyphomicrobiales bacterium]MBN9323511.1 AlpA family phage regulatory protein [Delftia acidovorans]